MKMNYIINTRHDEAAYRAYAKVHMEARATPLTKAISILIGLLCVSGGVMAMVQTKVRLLYLATVVVGLLCIVSQPLGLWRMRRRLLKNAQNIRQNIDYFFDEHHFYVEYGNQKESHGYDEIRRIVVTEPYFFVYTDIRMAHILPRAHFSQGDPNRFCAFLEEKSGQKAVQQKL